MSKYQRYYDNILEFFDKVDHYSEKLAKKPLEWAHQAYIYMQYPFKTKEVPDISDEEWLKAIDRKMGGPPLNLDEV